MRGLPLLTSLCVLVCALLGADSAVAQSTGGAGYETKPKTAKPRAATVTPGPTATIGPDGLATAPAAADRKSTRLNSSHANISYAVFCLKKKRGTHREVSDRHRGYADTPTE